MPDCFAKDGSVSNVLKNQHFLHPCLISRRLISILLVPSAAGARCLRKATPSPRSPSLYICRNLPVGWVVFSSNSYIKGRPKGVKRAACCERPLEASLWRPEGGRAPLVEENIPGQPQIPGNISFHDSTNYQRNGKI